jgi:hypothetical protein
MAAAELGIYEAIGKNSKTADELALECKTHPEATKHLLDALLVLVTCNGAMKNIR